MDPNFSTVVPEEYTGQPLSETTSLSLKFYTFGSMAIVISGIIGLGVYIVFFRKKHLAKKEIRLEKEVCCILLWVCYTADFKLSSCRLVT
jgi:hypothetical protein